MSTLTNTSTLVCQLVKWTLVFTLTFTFPQISSLLEGRNLSGERFQSKVVPGRSPRGSKQKRDVLSTNTANGRWCTHLSHEKYSLDCDWNSAVESLLSRVQTRNTAKNASVTSLCVSELLTNFQEHKQDKMANFDFGSGMLRNWADLTTLLKRQAPRVFYRSNWMILSLFAS